MYDDLSCKNDFTLDLSKPVALTKFATEPKAAGPLVYAFSSFRRSESERCPVSSAFLFDMCISNR